MSPDKQKLMEDIHSSYHRLFGLAESMEMIDGVSLPLIDEAKQALIHMAGCLEDALAVSEDRVPDHRLLDDPPDPEYFANVIKYLGGPGAQEQANRISSEAVGELP